MELQNAIKHVAETDGQDALLELRIVNILDDFKAYEDVPSARYILRAIIADGCMHKFMQIGAWNMAAKQLSDKFATATGFMPETVELIFQSIAYGIGWIQSVNISTNTTQSCPKQQSVVSSWHSKMTDEEKNQYLMSFVEIEHDTEKTFGVEISNISFEVDSDKEITAYCELINNKQKDDQIMLKYALYDLNGRVRGTQTFEYRKKKDIKIKPVRCYMDELKADKIGKIRLWIESW